MSSSCGLAAGLAVLPIWVNSAHASADLNDSLRTWLKAAGYLRVGYSLMVQPTVESFTVVTPSETDTVLITPSELSEIQAIITRAKERTVDSSEVTPGRFYVALDAPGVPQGLLWAERASDATWTEEDRQFLRLSAELIARSAVYRSAVAAMAGHLSYDAERVAQRLHDVAQVAGRMAHDFDNVLTGIIGYCDLTAPLVTANERASTWLGEIHKAGQRGIVFTKQLHELSRSGRAKATPTLLNQVVEQALARYADIASPAVQFHLDVPDDVLSVAMDKESLSMVLNHLLSNAVEAMPSGGTLRVTARRAELNSHTIKNFLGQPRPDEQEHLILTIADTGPGIKATTLAKLFAEPFTTTKVGHRGLGLVTVYRTLLTIRGGIAIESSSADTSAGSQPSGTTIRLLLPLATGQKTNLNQPLATSTGG